MLPEHLRHHRAGSDPRGEGRQAFGLFVRGVVTAVRFPDQHITGDVPASAVPCVLCDVVVFEPRLKTELRDVPILVQSGGYAEQEVWVPKAATKDIDGGTLDLLGKGGTAAHDCDGDQVVVGFLGGDLAQPFIIGQLTHPRTTQRPTDQSVRWSRLLAGSRVSIATDGTVTIVPATKVVVTDGLDPAPSGVITSDVFLPDVQAAMEQIANMMIGLGFPADKVTTLAANIASSMLTGNAPYKSAHLETD